MKHHVFKMQIIGKKSAGYTIRVTDMEDSADLLFCPEQKKLSFIQDNRLSRTLQNHEYQLRKILHNKRPHTFEIGFSLRFSLRDQKDVQAFNDRSRIVVLDKTGHTDDSYVTDHKNDQIDELYIDGSFCEHTKTGGYAVLHKDPGGRYTLYTGRLRNASSSLTELSAAIRGVQILRDKRQLRIISDSLYVRKGLTEWIHHWKLNDWHTANGQKVKNIDRWKEFDRMTQGKRIEFQWVKAHTDHFENTICDLYAKEKAQSTLSTET